MNTKYQCNQTVEIIVFLFVFLRADNNQTDFIIIILSMQNNDGMSGSNAVFQHFFSFVRSFKKVYGLLF